MVKPVREARDLPWPLAPMAMAGPRPEEKARSLPPPGGAEDAKAPTPTISVSAAACMLASSRLFSLLLSPVFGGFARAVCSWFLAASSAMGGRASASPHGWGEKQQQNEKGKEQGVAVGR
mmetsp:Transcript_17482/g.35685  ORF Transcript_17482/g.35685 Transcript_17482/m.35685 type:complete len:120 (+) Transcript_17482:1716-2075(+)